MNLFCVLMKCVKCLPRPLRLPPACPDCHGRGWRGRQKVVEWLLGIRPGPCPTCGGAGRVPASILRSPERLYLYPRQHPWN
jgi:hypothetical protein